MKTDLLSSASSAAIAAATVVAVTEAAHVIHWDIESRSLINLEEQGAARYASDPSTEVTVISYTVDDGPVEYYIPGHDPIPPVFFTAAADPSWRIASHNDAFETWMTVGVLGPRFGWPMVPIELHICTMAMARYHGLPGALEKVAAYLELPVQKDAAGKRLMLKLSRPDKNGNFIEPTADELKQLIAYCKRDVEVERAIFHALAALPASEQALWQLDQRINARGFAIDIALVARARHLAAIEKENINARLCTATCGAITSFTQVETIRKFVNARGLAMAELNKAAVIAALKLDIDSLAREVLELRQAAAGNIEAKFDVRDKSTGLLSWHHTRPLKTLRDILSEQARLYRATINGVISPADALKLTIQLREARCTREAISAEDAAIAAQEAAAQAAAAAAMPATPMNLNITVVPHGQHLTEAGRDKLNAGEQITSDDLVPFKVIEHHPQVENSEAPIDQEFKPQNERERRLLAELEALSPEQLLERAKQAGFVDVDGV